MTLSSKLNWDSYISSIAEIFSKKIGALIHSMKFLSPQVALYLYKSTKCPHMEYCCHVSAGSPSCHLELLDKRQNQACRTDGPLLAASLEPLAHPWNLASWSIFIGITLVDILENWLNWFHFIFLKGGLLVTLKDRLIFLSPF